MSLNETKLQDLSVNLAALISAHEVTKSQVSGLVDGTQRFKLLSIDTDDGGLVSVRTVNGKLFFESRSESPEAGWKITFNRLKEPSRTGISFYDRDLPSGFDKAFARYSPAPQSNP